MDKKFIRFHKNFNKLSRINNNFKKISILKINKNNNNFKYNNYYYYLKLCGVNNKYNKRLVKCQARISKPTKTFPPLPL